MQSGALETFDAILREVLISLPDTWCALNAWTEPEDCDDILTLEDPFSGQRPAT